LPIVYQLTLDAALKLHGKSQNPIAQSAFLTTQSKVQEMWRQITRVEQPAKQIKLDNNEKLERKMTYDQVKRKRKTSWQKNRNWLVHNSEIDRMTCSVC
jgi:hypothetical protein